LAVDSQNLLPDRQKVSPHITVFYKYSIFTFTMEILLAVICTDPGSEVLSFKSSFLHIEPKHVYLKAAVLRIYGQELFPC
jgi:hypothetical protein